MRPPVPGNGPQELHQGPNPGHANLHRVADAALVVELRRKCASIFPSISMPTLTRRAHFRFSPGRLTVGARQHRVPVQPKGDWIFWAVPAPGAMPSAVSRVREQLRLPRVPRKHGGVGRLHRKTAWSRTRLEGWGRPSHICSSFRVLRGLNCAGSHRGPYCYHAGVAAQRPTHATTRTRHHRQSDCQ